MCFHNFTKVAVILLLTKAFKLLKSGAVQLLGKFAYPIFFQRVAREDRYHFKRNWLTLAQRLKITGPASLGLSTGNQRHLQSLSKFNY